jgi:hypothetical protein
MTVLFLVLVSFVVAMAASLAIIHAVNPELWKHFGDVVPDVITHF